MFNKLTKKEVRTILIGITALIVLPIFVKDAYFLHILILAMLFAIFASSWNLVTGFGGLKTFGHHAFFGIGAYVSALLAINFGLSPWLTMWIGGLSAAFIGVLLALSILRIRSVPHVAIVTLAFAEIIRMVSSNLKEITRGEMALWGIPTFDTISLPLISPITFGVGEKVSFYYLILILFVVSILIFYRLIQSKIGLAIVAIRESQESAASLGVNVNYYKLVIFSISAFVVGVCGAFYAHYILVITPSVVMGSDLMISIIAIVLIGGLGTISGPIIGAFVLILGAEGIRFLGEYRMLFYGSMIMLIVMFLPRGLASGRDYIKSLLTYITTVRKGKWAMNVINRLKR